MNNASFAGILLFLVCSPLSHAQWEKSREIETPAPAFPQSLQSPYWSVDGGWFDVRPTVVPRHDFADVLQQSSPQVDPWRGFQYDPGRLKLTRESILEAAKVESSLDIADLRASRDTPWRANDWRAQESLNLPLPASNSLFVFGKVDGESESFDSRRMRLTGRTGLGMKWSPIAKSELQVRSGPVVNVSDLSNAYRFQEKPQFSLELQAKLAMFGPLQLQYSGEALPALLESDRHTILQDVKLALPFGTNREFHIGAKYRWEDLSATPWLDRTQLYLGLKLQH